MWFEILETLAFFVAFYFLAQAARMLLKKKLICPICFSMIATSVLGVFTRWIPLPFVFLLMGQAVFGLAESIRAAMKENQVSGYEYAKTVTVVVLTVVCLVIIWGLSSSA